MMFRYMIYKIFSVLFFLLATPSIGAQELLYVSSGDALEVKKINPQTGMLIDFQRIEFKGISVSLQKQCVFPSRTHSLRHAA